MVFLVFDSMSLQHDRLLIYTAILYTIGPVPVYRVTQVRTDHIIYCREPAGKAPIVIKVVPVKGAAFSGITMDQFIIMLFTSLFPNPLFKLVSCSGQHVVFLID